MSRFKNLIMPILAMCFMGSFANACENIVTTTVAVPTDWYDPCGTFLRYHITFEVVADGSPHYMLIIQGAGIEQEFSSGEFPMGEGEIWGTANFEDGHDHKAVLDMEPDVGHRGFVNGKLSIEYFPDQQQ